MAQRLCKTCGGAVAGRSHYCPTCKAEYRKKYLYEYRNEEYKIRRNYQLRQHKLIKNHHGVKLHGPGLIQACKEALDRWDIMIKDFHSGVAK